MTYLPSYVRQNMAVTVGHVPCSGERSCKAMNHPALCQTKLEMSVVSLFRARASPEQQLRPV
jgi:hypothetical protein